MGGWGAKHKSTNLRDDSPVHVGGEGVGGRDVDTLGLNDGIAVGKLFVLGFGHADDPDKGTGSVGVRQGKWMVGTMEEAAATSSA